MCAGGEGGLCVWRSSKVVESTFSLSATPLALPGQPTTLAGQKQTVRRLPKTQEDMSLYTEERRTRALCPVYGPVPDPLICLCDVPRR